MSVIWNLRELLKQQGFKTASDIAKIIYERTRYRISTQAVCDLLNGEPKMLRIDTAKAFCDAFGLRLGEFFEILPGPPRKLQQMFGVRAPDVTGSECDLIANPTDSNKERERLLDSSANNDEEFSSLFLAAAELCASKHSTITSHSGNSM